jgi:hypothetical protein
MIGIYFKKELLERIYRIDWIFLLVSFPACRAIVLCHLDDGGKKLT